MSIHCHVKLHVLDTDNDNFLLGWDIMCNFHKITLKPQENSIEFTTMFEQNTDSVSNVCASVNTVIPPRTQRILHVTVDKPSSFMLIERFHDFEEKTGLLFGRTVSSGKDPSVILMNPNIYTKTVYKAQTVSLATKLSLCQILISQ